MKIDIEFLRSHNLMDYSLLLGIEISYDKQRNSSMKSSIQGTIHEGGLLLPNSQPLPRPLKASILLK